MSRLIATRTISATPSIFADLQFPTPTNVRSMFIRSLPPSQLEVDVYATEEQYLILADLPAGVKEDDLELDVSQDTISITAKRDIAPIEGYTPIEQNRRPGRFHRTILLEKNINESEVVAEVVNQVLWINLPFAKTPKSSEVAIKFVNSPKDSKLASLLAPSKGNESTENPADTAEAVSEKQNPTPK